MHSTHLRREAIHGALVGTAFGERLGLALGRRSCPNWKIRAVKDRQGELSPTAGFYGEDTHLMLMAAQSILNSSSVREGFQKSFTQRLGWHQLSLPCGMSLATHWAASRSWLYRLKVSSGVFSTENSPLSRAAFLGLALHGTGHSLRKWVSTSTKLTHNHPVTIDASCAFAAIARIAANAKPNQVLSEQILSSLASLELRPFIEDKIALIINQMQLRRSPRATARLLGWGNSIPNNAEATMLMASFCFLRYPTDYFRATSAASLLGGDQSTLCALVGGLVGAHVGFQALPETVRKSSFPLPHGQAWMKELSERLSHWPHGAEDLNRAPSLKSRPLMQFLRNLVQRVLSTIGFVGRLPLNLVASLLRRW